MLVRILSFASCVLALMLGGKNLAAATVTFSTPQISRWMYPFNPDLTGRPTASTFGAVDSFPSFDQHDAQVLSGFDTTSGATPVPAGLGAMNYAVTAASVTMTIASGSFVYDPTYDGYGTYLTPANDSDAGRPVELYGVGFRGGYGNLALGVSDGLPPGFEEGTAFAPPGPPAASVRRAFPLTFDGNTPLDASNNIAELRENFPFAIGATGLAVGDTITTGTTLTFELDVNDPNIQAYLQQGLDDGLLGFMAASLHAASQGGPPTYPNFYTRQNTTLGAIAPTLNLMYSVVPEPGSLALLGCGGLALVGYGLRLRRARRQVSHAMNG